MRSYGRLFTNGHFDGRRSTRRISPRVLFAGIFVLALSLGACSNDQRPMDEPTTQLELQDASMPDVVFEGESATISAWGQQNSAAFTRLEAEVVSWPSNVPGKIEIRAIGETDTDMNGVDFQGQVQLPPLRAGDYDVHLTGSDTVRTLTVLPGQGWVRYRSFDDPMRPDVALLIEADGMAIAHRTDGGHVVRTVLSEEQRAAVRS
ncbi:MAG: hypothetical protein R3E12_14660 [Candidatus Eisenbacteria bacterium]